MNPLNYDNIANLIIENKPKEIDEKDLFLKEYVKSVGELFKPNNHKSCPICKSADNVIKYGKSNRGIQRYRCKKCRKVFSDITGSPLSYSKKPIDLWIKYMFFIEERATLRQIAKSLKIDLKTAFHWRHKILSAAGTKIMNKKLLNIEVDEVKIKESFKGNHTFNKNFLFRRIDKEEYMLNGQRLKRKNIIILNCKDKYDNKFIKPSSKSTINREILNKILKPIINETSDYISSPRNWAYFYFAKDNNIKAKIDGSMGFILKYFKKIVILNKDGKHNLKIRKRGREFKKFLKDFHNVASKYLSFYINWFVLVLEESNKCFVLFKNFITSKKQLKVSDFSNVNYKGEILRNENIHKESACGI